MAREPRGKRNKRFSYSLTSVGVLMASVLLGVTVLSVVFLSLHNQRQLREQYLDYVVRLQSQFNSNTAENFSTVDKELFQLGTYNTNISLINTAEDSHVFYRAKMTLYRELSTLAPVFPRTDGLFFYSPARDDYTPYVSRPDTVACSHYIRDYLTENRETMRKRSPIYRNWQLVQYNGSNYLVRFVISDGGILGAWTSLSTLLSSFRNVLPDGSYVTMLDPEDGLLQRERFSDYVYQDAAISHYQPYTAPDGTRYMVNAYDISYTDCRLVVFTPEASVTTYLSPFIKNTLIAVAGIILAVAALSLLLKRMIDMPIRPMKLTLKALQDGSEKAPLLSTSSRCVEVQQMVTVLNGMLGDIQRLQAQLYEDQLAKTKLELQFLKSQITPHFLINCLNTFAFLASSNDENDRDAAHRLTQTLSQHIRYSFASGELIPLSQEFDHLDNYLELASIRYPGSLGYELTLPEACKAACLPPMALMTLCENTVKHNLIMGEWLKITVTAQLLEQDGGQFVHICFLDNGTGFPPEALERSNHILERAEEVRNGQHIGIYNVVKSCQLAFRDKAHIVFSNEPGAGARVDIRVPFIRKEGDV